MLLDLQTDFSGDRSGGLVYPPLDDNSIDEALAGYCKHIQVTIGLDNSITVEDDGRGIPVSMHTTKHKPQCEIALTMLHAGGKFNNSVYKFSGGLHGVGVSCVNALSVWLVLTIVRDGHKYRMRFSRGKTTEQLQDLGECQGPYRVGDRVYGLHTPLWSW